MAKGRKERIYIIHATTTNAFKVGYTTRHPEKRRRNLQVGCPQRLEVWDSFEIKDGSGEFWELEAHKWLDHCHIRGEWFQASPEGMQKFVEDFAVTDDLRSFPVRPQKRLSNGKIASATIRTIKHLNGMCGMQFDTNEIDACFPRHSVIELGKRIKDAADFAWDYFNNTRYGLPDKACMSGGGGTYMLIKQVPKDWLLPVLHAFTSSVNDAVERPIPYLKTFGG